jgi:hypothetical protein
VKCQRNKIGILNTEYKNTRIIPRIFVIIIHGRLIIARITLMYLKQVQRSFVTSFLRMTILFPVILRPTPAFAKATVDKSAFAKAMAGKEESLVSLCHSERSEESLANARININVSGINPLPQFSIINSQFTIYPPKFSRRKFRRVNSE